MIEHAVKFSVSAANLNLADTTPYVFFDPYVNTRMVRVPTRLELKRNAGTAYTVANVQPSQSQGVGSRDHPIKADLDSYTVGFGGGQWVLIEGVTDLTTGNAVTARYENTFFAIPIINFLDKTTEKSIVVFPFLDGRIFNPGDLKFRLRTTCNISGGTGSLDGILYFTEYPTQ